MDYIGPGTLTRHAAIFNLYYALYMQRSWQSEKKF